MKPRSGARNVLMSAPRSITRATRSSPWEILMWSTAVSMAGNVLNMRSVRTPGSNGVYRFGSQVSVCAIPPAIHNTMTASAVASERARLGMHQARLAPGERGERGACSRAHERAPSDEPRENGLFVAGHVGGL